MEDNDPILEAFIFETDQQIEQLEQAVITADEAGAYGRDVVNDIFRYMHTIKGSAAMMAFDDISKTAHAAEDLFFFIREKEPSHVNCSSLSDLVLEVVDFFKLEMEKVRNGDQPDQDAAALIDKLRNYLRDLEADNPPADGEAATPAAPAPGKNTAAPERHPQSRGKHTYKAVILFQEDCQMENVRGYVIIHNLQPFSPEIHYVPEDILDNNDSAEYIKKNGFTILFKTDKSQVDMQAFFERAAYVRAFTLEEVTPGAMDKALKQDGDKAQNKGGSRPQYESAVHHGIHDQSGTISVPVRKLDRLLNLVGELVISETMVAQSPDLQGRALPHFEKSARQLHKIAGEMQDIVLSVRMLPIGPTFFKMNRIVRDMKKKLNKEVDLIIAGEDTEMDKSIIEHLGDPLMHLVRNSLDHGIESPAERLAKGKSREGHLTLEARNAGNEVLVTIADDGQGLDREAILKKAADHELLRKPAEDMTDSEVYNLICLPGFSTNQKVTEYSGRGVGMDVVLANMEAVGGSVQIDSRHGQGTTITLKIPLTLAIIDGMNFRVGPSVFTLPVKAIQSCFRPKKEDLFRDLDGNDMMMIRDACYPVISLQKLYGLPAASAAPDEGIVIVLAADKKPVCLCVDELIGEQQVVVKAMPSYIKKIRGLAGCTLLGNGGISLILDVDGLIA